MTFFLGEEREKFHKRGDADNDEQIDWEPIISIGTAAKKVNLSVSALRKYEREGLLIFHRTETGRRLLSRSDIRRIELIQHMINDVGLNMEGIRRLLALLPCWDLKPCSHECDRRSTAECQARTEPRYPCWMLDRNLCACQGEDCRNCNVYRYGAYRAETMKSFLHAQRDTNERNADT